MEASNIVSLLGGIAMFLFGMSVMGDSLKKVAGSKMEQILYRLAGNPVKGVLLGAGVTAVIQSSSATSVMVVGFVNSGMMQVRQAIGIVLGAILGTSITGWILCLNSIGGSGASVASLFSTEILTGVVALILSDYERISDHCSNIAGDVLEAVTGDLWTHEFHSRPEFRENKLFKQHFSEYAEKYALA